MRVDGAHRPQVDGLPGQGINAVVWKHEIPVSGRLQVDWPSDAQVVHVAPHPELIDTILVWTMHTQPAQGKPMRRFRWIRVVGTGEPIPTPCTHLGTAVTSVGLVWHLMEIR